MRRRHGDVAAAVVLASFLAACATPPKPTPTLRAPAPVVAAPASSAPPTEASPPPVAIGPRTIEPAERAPRAPRREPTPPPPTVPPTPTAQRGRFVVLNFDNADIETVVHAASEIVGFNYVLAPDVRGKVTVQTSGRIPQEDVFGVLLAILEVHGFTAVRSGNLYKIVKLEGARERAVPLIVGDAADPSRSADEVITQIVPVRYASVADLSSLLRPLISTRGALIAHRETNVLVITDTASNIQKLLEIVAVVDVEVALDELAIIPLRFADAADLANILNQLFTSSRLRRAMGAPGGPGVPGIPGAPAAPAPALVPGAVPGLPSTTTTGAAGADRGPLIIAERRSNSLIVYARRQELDTIRRLISQLDVNIYGGRRVFVYYAENTKSKDLAATLNSIYGAPTTGGTGATTPTTPGRTPTSPFGGPPPPTTAPVGASPTGGALGTLSEVGVLEGQVRFIADETTNAVIVLTFPRVWTEIETTIRQLDKMPRQVLIEVLVAEIVLTDATSLGLDWAIRNGRFNFANLASGGPPVPLGGLPINSSVQVPLTPGLTAFTFAANEFLAILNALAAESRVNVLSNPHILTSENKKAVINVSQSVPIITSQQAALGGIGGATTTSVGTQTVEYRDAGVILTVTPRIGEQGTVALDVKQEVNSIGANQPPTNSPIINKREAETSVILSNNQTLVLGGLIQDTLKTSESGIPFMKNIPLLGYLFGTKQRQIEKTELLILITPRVIITAAEAARITEDTRKATPELDDTFRRAPRPPSSTPPRVAPPRALPAPPPVVEPPAPPPTLPSR